MPIRERLDGLSRTELAGLAVVVIALLGGAVLWYVRSLPKPVEIAAPAPADGPPASASPSAAATVIVDVAGAVRRPGVYELPAGERVIDAIELAGGAIPKGDTSALNLAAPLVDGSQILVPVEGGAAEGGSAPVAGGTAPGGLVNVNTADAATLETLNGIGEVLAAAIIAYRDEHGPFPSVDALEDVSGIGPSTLENLRSQVTV